ncbi:MAG TPA: SpoIVB peptidase S55 domain-containing protein, partial [Polyangia bacterium]|nr:SpoIVB peptidase S55 domain-containing protein [Polyangia bacterium]
MRRVLGGFFPTLALMALGAGPASAEALRTSVPPGPPPAILPLSQVRPGMEGYALTVFSGTKPDRFKVRVVAVMKAFLPKEDVILIRAEDPRVEFSGIVAGMSGSPVYIDGKLMGAVAYAWSFAKEPLGGVTPIESMLAERRRPRRVAHEYFAQNGSGGGTKSAEAGGQEPLRIPAAMSAA